MKLLTCLVALGMQMASASCALAESVVGDITFERKSKGADEFAPAVFPHWVHRVKYKCYACHNKQVNFAMKADTAAITMDLIDQGKFCGTCHKGKPAFGVSFETCIKCHRK